MKNPLNPSQDWPDFEQEILEVAAVFSELRRDPYDLTAPKIIAEDLKAIDTALTVVLQAIASLQLEHQEGQDTTEAPYNWPVVQALIHAHNAINAKHGTTNPPPAAYPTDLIRGLRELREAARFAYDMEKPRRGNSLRRNPSSARMAYLAKNFVIRYRSRFGYMPPMSKSGPVVDLLQRMFEAAGENSNDVTEQLRKAIENDTTGRESLLTARAANASKRPK